MPDVYYSFEEEQALINGVAKHGKGNWRIILSDPDFRDILKYDHKSSRKHFSNTMENISHNWPKIIKMIVATFFY